MKDLLFWATAVAAFSTVSCSSAYDEEALQTHEQPLVVASSRLWSVSDFPLAVCFQSTGNGTTAQRLAVKAAVEGAWVGLPGSAVAFSGWGTCANDSSSGDIRVFLDSSITRSSSHLGTDCRASSRSSSLRVTGANLNYAYIHEFGHVLGIEHEQEHPDSTCSSTEALDFDAVPVTPYDPNAIMNYCGGSPAFIDPYETFFPQLFYPNNDGVPMACANCFTNGTKVLSRSNGVLEDTFTARGAYNWWGPGTQTLTWASTSGTVGSGGPLPASVLGAGVHSLDYSAWNKYKAVFISSVVASVNVDDATWTAVAMTVL